MNASLVLLLGIYTGGLLITLGVYITLKVLITMSKRSGINELEPSKKDEHTIH